MVTAEKRIERGLKLMATTRRGSSKWYWAMRCVIRGTTDLECRGQSGIASAAWSRGIGKCVQHSVVAPVVKPRAVRWSTVRDKRVREMRESGATFTAIGREFGVSKQRAAQICEKPQSK